MSDNDSLVEMISQAELDSASLLASLADRLRGDGRWLELLEVRLMQARLARGVSVDSTQLADAPADVRRQLEDDYVAACEEVGRGLLAAGRYRDAWYYLNTAGVTAPIRDALAGVTPQDETADELIEIALHHGANPSLGYRWLIDRYGTCNAVTTLEGIGPQLPVEALAGCAAVLVDHLHNELLASVRAHIEREEKTPPTQESLPQIIAERDWLFRHEAAHVDASHLSSTVRMARVLEAPDAVQKSAELADYGSRLHESLHYADAPPFEDVYVAHRKFFAAQLGQEVDAAATYFRQRAESADIETVGLAPLETLLVLLARVGRAGDALRAYGKLAPNEVSLSPYAPRPVDLARASGEWDLLDEVMLARGDVVALALGRVARETEGGS